MTLGSKYKMFWVGCQAGLSWVKLFIREILNPAEKFA